MDPTFAQVQMLVDLFRVKLLWYHVDVSLKVMVTIKFYCKWHLQVELMRQNSLVTGVAISQPLGLVVVIPVNNCNEPPSRVV